MLESFIIYYLLFLLPFQIDPQDFLNYSNKVVFVSFLYCKYKNYFLIYKIFRELFS